MEIDVDGPLPSDVKLLMSAKIMAIQLDAWKGGITHAAELIANRRQDDFVGLLLNDRDKWTAL